MTRSGSTRPRRRSWGSSPAACSPSGSRSCAPRGRAPAMTFSPGCPSCRSAALGDSDARALLLANVPGPIDAARLRPDRHGKPRQPARLARAAAHAGTSPVWPAGSVFLAVGRSPAGSSRATSGASSCCPRIRGCSSSPLPRSLSATLCCCTGPRGRSGSTSRRRARHKTAGCSSWAGGSSSRTRWSGPPPTARPPRKTGAACTGRWPRPPWPGPTRTGRPGTGPGPPWGPMRRSPLSWNARLAGRRRAVAWPRQRRSCNDPPSSPSIRSSARSARWLRRR